MIEPLTSQPALIDQVHDRLVATIADGTLPPGEPLIQENMAALLGVSRQPVSHALHLLRVRDGRAPTTQRKALEAALTAGRENSKGASVREMIDADAAFHLALHRLSGNAAITETVAAQWPHFMPAMGAALTDANRRRIIWSDHAAIAKHVMAGEPDKAETTARTHVQRAAGLEAMESVA